MRLGETKSGPYDTRSSTHDDRVRIPRQSQSRIDKLFDQHHRDKTLIGDGGVEEEEEEEEERDGWCWLRNGSSRWPSSRSRRLRHHPISWHAENRGGGVLWTSHERRGGASHCYDPLYGCWSYRAWQIPLHTTRF